MPDLLSMSEIDRRLGLGHGVTNYLRKQGLFVADQIGRGWFVHSSVWSQVEAVIRKHYEPPTDMPYITPQEAAQRLNVEVVTIYNQVRNGRLSGVRRGRRLYVSVVSVESYRLNRLPASVHLHMRNRKHGS